MFARQSCFVFAAWFMIMHLPLALGAEFPCGDLQVYLSWMVRRDMPQVIEIERESFEFPWTEDDFVKALRQRNAMGMVAEYDGKVVGFAIYELQNTRVHILNFAVAKGYRRHNIGAQMIGKMKKKIGVGEKRTKILVEVRESNLDGQQFLKQMGFRAVSTLKSFYEDTAEDAYMFQYRAVADSVATNPQAVFSDNVKPSASSAAAAPQEPDSGLAVEQFGATELDKKATEAAFKAMGFTDEEIKGI